MNGSFESYVEILHYPKERSVLETKLTVHISLVKIKILQVLEDVLITSEDKNWTCVKYLVENVIFEGFWTSRDNATWIASQTEISRIRKGQRKTQID